MGVSVCFGTHESSTEYGGGSVDNILNKTIHRLGNKKYI